MAFGLALGLIILSIVVSFSVSYYGLVVDSAYSTHTENFSFWLQVNDRYQMQRALAAIVESPHIDAAFVRDSFGQIISSKGSDTVIGYLSDKGTTVLTRQGVLLKYSSRLTESAAIPKVTGEIVVGILIPYVYFFLCILGPLACIGLTNAALKRSFEKMTSKMAIPVRDLAITVAHAKDLKDLQCLNRHSSSFIEVQLLVEKIQEMSTRLVHAERSKELFNLSRQVAHDIRSPLSALRMTVASAKNLEPDRKALVMSVATRIEKIASDLLDQSRPIATNNRFDIIKASNELIQEKNASLICTGINIDFAIEGCMSALAVTGDCSEFQRILSNLLNNSIESLSAVGNIKVRIYNGPMIRVEVVDDGPGIPLHVLAKLRSGQQISTKTNGNGLGLWSAQETLKSWGGKFEITSEPSHGTKVTMAIPATTDVNNHEANLG